MSKPTVDNALEQVKKLARRAHEFAQEAEEYCRDEYTHSRAARTEQALQAQMEILQLAYNARRLYWQGYASEREQIAAGLSEIKLQWVKAGLLADGNPFDIYKEPGHERDKPQAQKQEVESESRED